LKDRFLLLLYMLALLLLSSLSSIKYLLLVFSFLLLANAISLRSSLGRAIRPPLFALFTALFISTPYALWTGHYSYALLLTLRVLNLTLLTLLVLRNINLYLALGFSKTLSQLLVLTSSHILLYRRVFSEFKDSLRSRSPEGPQRRDMINFSGGIGLYFFDRALRDSEEVAKAMKSRGFDID